MGILDSKITLSSVVSTLCDFRLLNENSMFSDLSEPPNMKRHSEGTFSNDYSKYLETRRAQDFVQWLKNSKRNGWVSIFHSKCEIFYTNELNWMFGVKRKEKSGLLMWEFAEFSINLNERNSENMIFFLDVSSGVYSGVMRTAPTPATSAPTCRTRQQRSLCPGWRPAGADETKLHIFFTDFVPLTLFFYLYSSLSGNKSSQSKVLLAFTVKRNTFLCV